MALLLVQLLLGLAILMAGNELLLRGMVNIGRGARLLGVIAAGFGSAVPKLVVTMQAASGGSPDMALGIITGGVIVNMGLVLGLAAIAGPLGISRLARREGWLMTAAALLLAILCLEGEVSRASGFMLLLVMIAYGGYAVRTAEDRLMAAFPDIKITDCRWCASAYLFTGLALMFTGADIFVDGGNALARALHLSEAFTGLTLAAVCTSLSLCMVALAAVQRRQSGLLITAITANTLFALLGIAGLSALLVPLPVAPVFLHAHLWAMVAACLLAAGLFSARPSLGKREGIVFVALCLAYGVYAYFLPSQ